MVTAISRRKLVIGLAGTVAVSTLPKASAGRFWDAVINFVEINYERSLRELTQDGLRYLVEKVLPVEDRLLGEAVDLRSHFDQNWSSFGSDDTQSHTEKCPYCLAVAREVERRAPELDPVANRIPKCFIINGAQYITSDWGTLHRYGNGGTGNAEGTIWFSNGEYVGRGNNGQRFLAIPNC